MIRDRKLSDQDWAHLFWTAHLTEREGEVFLRREVLEESAHRVGRQLDTTVAAVRAALNLAWKKLQEHDWNPQDVEWVLVKLHPFREEQWAQTLADCVLRSGPTVYRRGRIAGIVR